MTPRRWGSSPMTAWVKSLLLFVCTCGYIFLGGFTFVALEHRQAAGVHRKLSQALAKFVVNHDRCGVTEENLRNFLEDVVVKANDNGVFWSNSHPANGIVEIWTLSNAFLFAFEVVTTIGQGGIVPMTFTGRLVCIFYAVLGVPLCYLMLSAVGDTCYFMWRKLGKLFSRIRRPQIRVALGVTVTLLVMSLVLIQIPALVVTYHEMWNFFTSQYHCFMILSTVGLGDLSRSLKRSDTLMVDWAWKAGSVLYDLFCLSIVSVILKGANEYRLHVRAEAEQRRELRSDEDRGAPKRTGSSLCDEDDDRLKAWNERLGEIESYELFAGRDSGRGSCSHSCNDKSDIESTS